MEKLRDITIAIAFDNEINKLYYKNSIEKINHKVFKFIDLSKINKHISLKIDLLIIDISSKTSILNTSFFKISKNTKIIIVSPFLEKYLNTPKNINSSLVHCLMKPLDKEVFYKLLERLLLQIIRNKYLQDKKKVLLQLVDKSPFKMAVYDKEGNLVYANHDYLDTYSFELDFSYINFNNIVKCDIKFEEVLFNLKNKQVYVTSRNGSNRWYKSHFYYINQNKYIAHIFYDITEEKNSLESLKKMALFFEKSSEGVLITDSKGIVLTVNTSFSKITGYTKDEIIGVSTKVLASGIHERSFYENLWDSLKFQEKWQGEIWNRRKNGEIYPEWLSITQIKDEETSQVNYLALFTDISSIKEADKKLHFYAKHDPLTGLLNRTQFENLLSHSINKAQRNTKKFALMYIDLDHFKEVNDTYGHNVGDIMLRNIASIIKRTLRKEDIIARVGGDEFNVIIDDIKDEADALNIASKLNEAARKEIKIHEKTFYMSFSIGISIYPNHGLNSTELIKNADSAMYQVKKAGRDSLLLYDAKFTKNLIKKVNIQNKLKKAIKKESFEIYYQAVYDLSTSRIIGAEALLRWYDKEEGFISPEKFIVIAEEHGMIIDLGQIVLKKSFDDLRLILNHTNKEFKLSINVSSREFFDDNYILNLNEKLRDFNINPSNIELEITETYVMKNYEKAIEKFNFLKKLGISLALDDFGTGYSSLSYLKSFPIDKLKIDKSFVLDILENKDDALIVQTIINMARIFNFKVQAEGLESAEHEILLKNLDCDLAQGYYYSKPLSLSEFIKFLKVNHEFK